MRLAVITWFHYKNYGTALQVYALCNYLKSVGHDVNVIRYYPRNMGKVLPDYSFKTTFKNVMRHRVEKVVPLKRVRKNTSSTENKVPFYNEQKETLFEDFIHEALEFTDICENLSELESLNDQYDAFICGSDQIWAPNIFDPHYFLDFIKDKNKLISYAPSIGLPKVEDKYVYKEMSDLIKRIKFLSVREKKGAQIIKKMTGREATLVVDPTLLLSTNQWRAVGGKNSNEDSYMLVYMLGSNNKHWQEIYHIAENRHLKVRVIPVFEKDLKREGCIVNPIGPKEFISLFESASYVCTDSFHGTIFSLVFHKQFSVFERFAKDDKLNQNSRIYNILAATRTKDRLIPYNCCYTENQEIDFGEVDSLLDQWIKESKQFLKNSLDGVGGSSVKQIANHILYDHSLCCGCGACAYSCPQKAIEIIMSEEGFYQASVDEKNCINCGKCRTVCQFESNILGIYMQDGYYYSYKDNRQAVLMRSSSGGIAYSLAKIFLEKGYAVIGCTYDVDLQVAKHILIDKAEDAYMLQGSKYMQSSFSHILEQIADSAKPVVIFGTPCQIAAVKKIFPEREDFLFIDLICHGVPTYNLLKKYKQYLADNYGSNPNTINIYNRYKPQGWRVRHTFTTDGKVETCFDQKEDLYFRMYESMNCYSSACYDCIWRDKTVADLRIGDFWGPLFENDNTGVSIVGCMTEKGKEIIDILRHENVGSLEPQSQDNYLRYQQLKNYAKPVFYDELIQRLGDNKTDLSFIVEKYAEPFEKQKIERNKTERRKHTLRLMLDSK